MFLHSPEGPQQGIGLVLALSGKVSPLQQVGEDGRDLVWSELPPGVVPLVQPVAHAKEPKDQECGREIPKPPSADPLPDDLLDGAVVLALLARDAPGHVGRQPALLAEEDGEEGELAGQQIHLVADEAAKLLIGREVLVNDLAQPGAGGLHRLLEDLAEEFFLARDVGVQGDLRDARLGGDGLQGGGPVSVLAKADGRGADDLLLEEGTAPRHSTSSRRPR